MGDHHWRGGFRNPWSGGTPTGPAALLRWLLVERLVKPRPPDAAVFSRRRPTFASRAAPTELTITWVGHSTFLIQIGGRNVLTDPMWGLRASPVAFVGPRRRVPPGIDLAALPPIDVVVQSHNHYDHLDVGTVRALAARHPGALWLVPLGLAGFVRRRGPARVEELDWWDERRDDSLVFGCAPAQHFSGRGVRDRNRTLWCSWAMAANGRRVYFGGDSGYHPDFAAIGERFGPFDAIALPIGAYEPRWFMRPVHMNPEEAVRVYRDITAPRARPERRPPVFVAMHWGTFRLTDEPLDEPPRRLRASWLDSGLDATLLRVLAHGETLVL